MSIQTETGTTIPNPPAGYVYVGQGPLLALKPHGTQTGGHLALLQSWCDTHPWNSDTHPWDTECSFNGQSAGTHYAVLLGTEAHDLLFPAAAAPATIMIEDKEEEPEENEGVTLPDGTTVPASDCIDVVVLGWCEHRSSYDDNYYERSANFRTAPMPEDYEGVRWLERENLHALESECDIIETSDGEYSFRENCRYTNGDWYHTDDISFDGHGDPYPTGSVDYVYCQGEGETYPRDECHWCEAADTYVYGDEEDCGCNRNESEDHINEYHSSPKPTFHCNYPCSGWGIGFEVEKNDINGASSEGEYVGSSDLFSGWECDASCGVEGITHVYDPHTCADKFKQHVASSKRWLDAACDRTCGGHINISSAEHTPRELLQAMRRYAPLWYALYRNRLNNTYCVEDKKVEHGTTKYSPLRTKSFGVELRLPPAVRNGEQLVRRFDLMSLCCTAIDEGWSLSRYVRSCKPLLFEQVYNKNRVRYGNMLRLTRKFDRWFKDGHIHADITQYV